MELIRFKCKFFKVTCLFLVTCWRCLYRWYRKAGTSRGWFFHLF